MSTTKTAPSCPSISFSGLPAGTFLLMVILSCCVPSNTTVVIHETGSFILSIFSFLFLSLSSEPLHITCGATSPAGCHLQSGSLQCTVTDSHHVAVVSGMLLFAPLFASIVLMFFYLPLFLSLLSSPPPLLLSSSPPLLLSSSPPLLLSSSPPLLSAVDSYLMNGQQTVQTLLGQIVGSFLEFSKLTPEHYDVLDGEEGGDEEVRRWGGEEVRRWGGEEVRRWGGEEVRRINLLM